MRKMNISYKELVKKNRELIIKDVKLQDKIEEKVESKLQAQALLNK